MQWEDLTEPKFRKAVEETGVCVVAIGVVEKHGHHLPLGTDFLNGHKLACLAAQREEAVVFPPFYFGQIYEARCFAGTITIPPELLVLLIRSVLDEIGRNGFKKIIIYNAHGGNDALLPFIVQCDLWDKKQHNIYLYKGLNPEDSESWNGILETGEHGHACECETSITMANFEDLVDRGAIPRAPETARKCMEHIPQAYTALSWYANYPNHYVGDAGSASKEKGLKLREIAVNSFASFIGQVKNDAVLPSLAEDFKGKRESL